MRQSTANGLQYNVPSTRRGGQAKYEVWILNLFTQRHGYRQQIGYWDKVGAEDIHFNANLRKQGLKGTSMSCRLLTVDC